MPVAPVKIGVIPVVGCLAYSATSVAKDLCVSAIFWTIGVIITEVPFAKHACGIAIVLEDLTHGDFVFA